MSGNRPGMSVNRPGMSVNRPGNRIILTVEMELDPGQREIEYSLEAVKQEILRQMSGIFSKNLTENRPQWTFTVKNSRIEIE
jgi:hypothetical protein